MAKGQGQKIVVMECVYPPSEDSHLLTDVLRLSPSAEDVLELCCGSGIVGLSLAPSVKRIVVSDLSPLAVMNTVLNYKRNGLFSKVDAVAGDLFQPLLGRAFDLVIMNPPYVADDGEASDLSWSGGPKGREIIDRFLNSVASYINPGGRAIFIQSDLNGVEETIAKARSNGMVARIIGKRIFRFETLLAMEVIPG